MEWKPFLLLLLLLFLVVLIKLSFRKTKWERRFLEVEILKCPWDALPGFLFTISYITLFQLGQGFISWSSKWCRTAFLEEEQAALAGLRPPDERLVQRKACFRAAGEQPVKETAHPRAGTIKESKLSKENSQLNWQVFKVETISIQAHEAC